MTERNARDPQAWLQRQSRWSPFEIAFWLAALLPFLLFPTYLTLASQIAIAALFAISRRPGARLCRHRHARARDVLRPRRLRGGPDQPGRLGRAADRPRHCRRLRRAGRLCRQLHHRARPASRADHDHARPRPPDLRARQRHVLADRRHRRPARRRHLADLRRLRLRPLGLHRLRLRAGRAVPRRRSLSRRIVNSSFGLALRGIRENVRRMPAIGSDYRGPPAEDLHDLRGASPASPARC